MNKRVFVDPFVPDDSPQLTAGLIEPVETDYGMCTLVVVDMQPPFLAPVKDPRLMAAVVAEVKLAISRGWGIVLVEVKPWTYGETAGPIMELLRRKYERFTSCRKEGDDGSLEILEACSKRNYPDKFFRVTGVLINACVATTAWGLVQRRNDCRVRVVKEACGTNQEDVDGAWASFTRGPRVVVSSQLIDKQVDKEIDRQIGWRNLWKGRWTNLWTK